MSYGHILNSRFVARARIPIGKTDEYWWDKDIHGFGLRMRAGGSKTFVYQYKLGRKNRKLIIGHASVITVERAREIVRALKTDVKVFSRDPQGERYSLRLKHSKLHDVENQIVTLRKLIVSLERIVDARHG